MRHPLSYLFCFLSEVPVTKSAAQNLQYQPNGPEEHAKNDLQNITTEWMTQSVQYGNFAFVEKQIMEQMFSANTKLPLKSLSNFLQNGSFGRRH